jgi:hypothetical protein
MEMQKETTRQPQTQKATAPTQSQNLEQKIQKLQELYTDAPELGKVALEKGLPEFKREAAAATEAQNAGRIGGRQGMVSELTVISPFTKGGAKRLRALLELLQGHFQGADAVGTVHDMRFVFLDNDTKLLFATAYDGDWDAYIEDFATKIPIAMDVLFCNFEGWPGIRSPKVKDWIVEHQVAAESWYVANPNLMVAETRRLEHVGKAVEEFLDKIG